MIDPASDTARERATRIEHCARCGARFGCGVDTQHCWCADLPALRELPARPGSRCLCERCLRDAIARQEGNDAIAGAQPGDAAAGRVKNGAC